MNTGFDVTNKLTVTHSFIFLFIPITVKSSNKDQKASCNSTVIMLNCLRIYKQFFLGKKGQFTPKSTGPSIASTAVVL